MKASVEHSVAESPSAFVDMGANGFEVADVQLCIYPGDTNEVMFPRESVL